MLAWFAMLPSGTDGGHPQQVSVQSIRTVDKTEHPVYSADEFWYFFFRTVLLVILNLTSFSQHRLVVNIPIGRPNIWIFYANILSPRFRPISSYIKFYCTRNKHTIGEEV